MQQVVLTIDNQEIEKKLSGIAQQEGKDIQDIIMVAIQFFIHQKPLVPLKKLDPLRHSTQIHYEIPEDVSDVVPFSEVTDSAQFGEKLREMAWKRTT
jgi:hypothetical protein